MREAQNEVSIKTAGVLLHVITRSSPAYIVLFFYLVFSFFCAWFGYDIFWKNTSIVVGAIILLLWILKPERLWTENHSLKMKKLDLSNLGDKNNPQVESKDYLELFQPIPVKITNSKKAKIKGKK